MNGCPLGKRRSRVLPSSSTSSPCVPFPRRWRLYAQRPGPGKKVFIQCPLRYELAGKKKHPCCIRLPPTVTPRSSLSDSSPPPPESPRTAYTRSQFGLSPFPRCGGLVHHRGRYDLREGGEPRGVRERERDCTTNVSHANAVSTYIRSLHTNSIERYIDRSILASEPFAVSGTV